MARVGGVVEGGSSISGGLPIGLPEALRGRFPGHLQAGVQRLEVPGFADGQPLHPQHPPHPLNPHQVNLTTPSGAVISPTSTPASFALFQLKQQSERKRQQQQQQQQQQHHQQEQHSPISSRVSTESYPTSSLMDSISDRHQQQSMNAVSSMLSSKISAGNALTTESGFRSSAPSKDTPPTSQAPESPLDLSSATPPPQPSQQLAASRKTPPRTPTEAAALGTSPSANRLADSNNDNNNESSNENCNDNDDAASLKNSQASTPLMAGSAGSDSPGAAKTILSPVLSPENAAKLSAMQRGSYFMPEFFRGKRLSSRRIV